MTAYFISGLGADKRIFQKLILPEELSIIHLNWLEPFKGETMNSYCHRLARCIDTSKDFVLIGLSFGGMVATELSQIVHPKQTIIISSAGSRNELPWYLRLTGRLRLHVLVNPSFLKIPTPFSYWIFDTKTKEERQLLRQVLKDTSTNFLKWAISTILTWERTEKPEGIYHIHGSGDKVLPLQYVKADTVVPKGGHLMVFTLPETISRLLSARLGYS